MMKNPDVDMKISKTLNIKYKWNMNSLSPPPTHHFLFTDSFYFFYFAFLQPTKHPWYENPKRLYD